MTSLFHNASGVFFTHICRWRNRSGVSGYISGEQSGDLIAKERTSHPRYVCRKVGEKREKTTRADSMAGLSCRFFEQTCSNRRTYIVACYLRMCVRGARSVYVCLSPCGKSFAEKHPASHPLFPSGPLFLQYSLGPFVVRCTGTPQSPCPVPSAKVAEGRFLLF